MLFKNRLRTFSIALIIGAGSLAGTAWTRDSAQVANYSCANGERFSVETHSRHIRLRTGAGIFALTAAPTADGLKYTDGQTVFSSHGSVASLQRPGLPESKDCRRDGASL
ncbi:hypothetical protein GPA19_10310 [Azoarcus indigens]|uniref:Membrane-bound lysozyme inhibitor of c-type lysozyme MliC n=1 Tax=Azoarcus indigens TaxID=29545 RepID=A0A4R6EEQ6_9RHOO|nr:MliC family protein [Azoarcus indigens]NMG65340.1 hypothetical protein [Azoarcus indigens]TDN56724.1 membrane-bound lysozyme inhibitor of c-type lysozyme MliC [Azoarcus indigens]